MKKNAVQPVCLCDMDDTICDLTGPWTQTINRRFGTKIKRDHLVHWDIGKSIETHFPGKVPEDEIWRPIREPGLFRNLPLYPGSKEGLMALKSLGWRVVIVTSLPSVKNKPGMIVQEKYDWIEEHLSGIIEPRDLIFTHEKHLVSSGNVLIDDSPTHIQNFPNGVVMMDAPWNRNIETKIQRVRAKDWSRIAGLCQRLFLIQQSLG